MNKLKMKMTSTLLIAIFMISIFTVAIPVNADVYSYSTTVGEQPVSIVVVETETAVTWTIDFPGEAPYDHPITEGNGQWAVGLVIALDGDGFGPAFQIHNNDGATTVPGPHGTWLYGSWGPTIGDGWFGWPDHDLDVLVTGLDWVSCTGLRYNEVNPDGIFTISIDKSELGASFHWALNLAIGTGFWSTYMHYEQTSCPVGETDWFDWTNPIVNDEMPNYEFAQLQTATNVVEDLLAEGVLNKGQANSLFVKIEKGNRNPFENQVNALFQGHILTEEQRDLLLNAFFE